MVRAKKCRLVASMPGVTYFKPAGIPMRYLNEVRLSVEEAEALRLKDIEGLEQVEGAARMGVSRPTFQRILTSARRKAADALLNGKAIRIEGGTFKISGVKLCCHRGHEWVKPLEDGTRAPAACPVCGDTEITAGVTQVLPAGREQA